MSQDPMAADDLVVKLLGPLEVRVVERPLILTSGRMSALLSVLAMSAGAAVSVDRLATAVFGADLPSNPRRSVQTYITRLRSVLGTNHIVRTPAGYRLRVGPDNVDALYFLRLLADGNGPPDRQRLDDALAAWRGTPFEGTRSRFLEESERPRLIERYVWARERRIDLDMADGRHAGVVLELSELTASYPLRESLWARRLVALDRSGRQAEALELYDVVRRYLREQLGIEPGPELRRIFADLLAGRSPELPADPNHVARQPLRPHQLPRDLDAFAGRTDALAAMDDVLLPRAADDTGPGIAIVCGPPGIGKTATAVHWAYTRRHRFPDGELYVDLHGYHQGEEALGSMEALNGLLEALGVPPDGIPETASAAVGLYRTLLTGRRVIVVLDNARDAAQVRPLLPGGTDCAVVITSRDQLMGLASAQGAHPIALGSLNAAESHAVLSGRLDAQRLAAEAAAAEDIISICGGLPLALALVAARLAGRPSDSLGSVAADLARVAGSLDALTSGDAATDLRTVFWWSYRQRTHDAQRLFRLLALHPGPDISPAAAAETADLPMQQAGRLLKELSLAHMLTETRAGRYGFHDLARAYAVEQSRDVDTDPERHDAWRRMFQHYFLTAYDATLLLYPFHERADLNKTLVHDGATPERFSTRAAAINWFITERRGLVALQEHAYAHGLDAEVWQLAWAVEEPFGKLGYVDDLHRVRDLALSAAERLGETDWIADAHRGFARACLRAGAFSRAETHFRAALDLFTQIGSVADCAHALRGIGLARELSGHSKAAVLEPCIAAVALARTTDDRHGLALALNNASHTYGLFGDYQSAIQYAEEALALQRTIEDRHGEAYTTDTLALAYVNLGDYHHGIALLEHAAELCRHLVDDNAEATILGNLANAYEAAGDTPGAQRARIAQLTILEDLRRPEAELVRRQILAGPVFDR